MWSNKSKTDSSSGLLPGRRFFGPLILISITPITAIILSHGLVTNGGAFLPVFQQILTKGFVTTLLEIWPSPFDPMAWKLISIFMGVQLVKIAVIIKNPVV